MSETGIVSLRIDFRGFERSDGSDVGTATIETMIEDAENASEYLRRQASVDEACVGILGLSLGGGMAMISAAKHPQWYRSMVTWLSVGDLVRDFVSSLG